MLPQSDSRFTRIALVIFFILIVLYGLYEAQGQLFGPRIVVSTDITTVHESYVTIAGRALRITSLSMNGSPVDVTVAGDFSVPYLLAPGLNHVMLEAKDSYGRVTDKVVEIMYVPNTSATTDESPMKAASTTPLK